jgi:riboflavin synthase
MFTGIIEEVGTVEGYDGGTFKVGCSRVLEGSEIGHSIAVSGVCLTVTSMIARGLGADVSTETARFTTLGRLSPGTAVNLERAARLGQPMGGHLVQGHVDAVGRIMEIATGGLRVSADREKVLDYCVLKGSIAVDGISLTIFDLDETSFRVALIPHTIENTNLEKARPGDEVNLEVDIIAKYVRKITGAGTEGISEEFLAEHGYTMR